MDKWNAQQYYWSSFGIPAYDRLTVPEDAEFPYITYEPASGSLDGVMLRSASVWYRGGHDWRGVTEKVLEIESTVERLIKIDGGYMKVRKPSSNFAQRMDDPDDPLIRRVVLNVEIEFLTE